MAKAYKYERVMVIDDTDFDGLVTEKLLQLYGVVRQSIRINSPKLALEQLASIQSEPAMFPELIFLDFHMPEMNGLQFLEAYELLPYKKKNIILMTALASPSDKELILKSPSVLKFVYKPLNEVIAKSL